MSLRFLSKSRNNTLVQGGTQLFITLVLSAVGIYEVLEWVTSSVWCGTYGKLTVADLQFAWDDEMHLTVSETILYCSGGQF